MRRMLCILLALLCAVSLLTGCRSSEGQPQNTAPQTGTEPAQTGDTTGETEGETTEPVETAGNTESTETTMVSLPIEGTSGQEIALGQTGKVKIPYTVNRSSVRYITDPSQLPDYEELKGYDAAYFQDHALLLVVETVTSGSVDVAIGSVTLDGSIASVKLSHEMPDGMATADMTTWLLWAEVEAGYDCQWVLANPAVKSQEQAY